MEMEFRDLVLASHTIEDPQRAARYSRCAAAMFLTLCLPLLARSRASDETVDPFLAPAFSAASDLAHESRDGFVSAPSEEHSGATADQGPRDAQEECNHAETAGATFKLRGRVDTDFLWANQSESNSAVFGELPDVVGLRRARIGAEGNLGCNARYITEIDLASGNIVVRDMFLGCGDMHDTGEFRLGHMREPFSLEGGTSANTFAFLERSPVNDLDPSRNWGLGLFRCSPDEDATFGAGVFQSGTDSSDFQGGDGIDTALTAKGTRLLWYEEDGERLMHVGLALSARIPDRGVVVINQQSRSPLLDLGDSSTSPFVPTIRIPADAQQLGNVQWALVRGSFWAQAEWYGSLIEQRGGDPVFFHGSHFDIGYFLGGAHRSYQKRSGIFGPVAVDNPATRCFGSKRASRDLGFGAWELTARFAYLDYFDSNTPIGPDGQLVGIMLPQATAGVNWYLADRLRIMLNYCYVQPDEPNAEAGSASLFGMRLAMFW